MSTIRLTGCAPVPLAHYLKALAILRLISEQRDDSATGYWQGDTFVLDSVLDESALVEFFLKDYRPTPILVPWSGEDFFGVNREVKPEQVEGRFDNRPTSSASIEAVLATTTERLESYRTALRKCFAAMDVCSVKGKKDIEGSGNLQKRKKAELLQALRNSLPDDILPWLDAAVVIEEDAFSPNNLLGSGGGSDGNSHFSDNFMQSVWAVLPDFDCQRKRPLRASSGVAFDSQAALTESLLARQTSNAQLAKLSPVLFDSTRVGGPNSISGFESDSASNPWDFVLMIEGTCLFAGALAKKLGTAYPSTAHFPFLLSASPVGAGSLGQTDSAGKELWLPLWSLPAGLDEILELFASGRMESHKRMAASGMDAVQAIAQGGVDRGIDEFQRIGLFRGRIGGDNYFTSADLGRFIVSRNPKVDLLADCDVWFDSFRRAATAGSAPASAVRALRKLELAILALCKQGDAERVQDVLVALGGCEQAMAHNLSWTAKSYLKPVARLSPGWLQAADDCSAEYRLAASLASVYGKYGDTFLPLRSQLEPVKSGVRNGSLWVGWEPTAMVDVAWREGNVVDALNAVMARRVVLAQKAGGSKWPDTGRCFACPSDISAFIEGRVNFVRFADLLWGLTLLNWPQIQQSPWRGSESGPTTFPGAVFTLLKLCFAGTPVRDVEVPLVPAVHQRAATGQGAAATQLAARRLRASGLAPAVEQVHQQGEAVKRAAAALLFPISHFEINALAEMVLRPQAATL